MFWAKPVLARYDLYSINIDGGDGRYLGDVMLYELYSTPEQPDALTQALVAQLVKRPAADITLVRRSVEGTVEVWDAQFAIPTHRLRRSKNQASVETTATLAPPEKSCPQCGLTASVAPFVRGALMCREHQYFLGGC